MRCIPRWLLILAVVGSAPAAADAAALAIATPVPSPSVTVTADGLLVDWRVPPVQMHSQADGKFSVTVAGYQQTNQPGAPRLPVATLLLALPPGAQPTLTVRQLEEREIPFSGQLSLAPQPEGVWRDAAGNVIGGAFSPALPATDFDPPVIMLEQLGVLRGVRLARLRFYPVRQRGEQLRVATRLQVAVHFGVQNQSSLPNLSPDPLVSVLRAAVANPAHVQPVRDQPRDALSQSQTAAAAVEVASAGLTALTYEMLAAAGFPQANPVNLHLTHAGVEVAIEWDGDDDALFETGERLLFYAEPRFSRWTVNDVYLLSVGDTAGLRMGSRSADPAGLPEGIPWVEKTTEINAIYTPNCYCAPIPAGRDSDRWAWDDLYRPGHASGNYDVWLPDVDAAHAATLDLWLIGYTAVPAAPDHGVEVALNGLELGQIEWDGKQAIQGTFPVSSGILQAGKNTLSLTLPGLSEVSVEGAWLDAFALRYTRDPIASAPSLTFSGEGTPSAYTVQMESTANLHAYDVSDPQLPLQLSDFSAAGNTITLGDSTAPGTDSFFTGPYRYHLTTESGILSPADVHLLSPLQTASLVGADYLIITPEEFAPALATLIALRASQGLTVAVEYTQAIYNAYGGGLPTPDGIHAFLANAYTTWNPTPLYVLLVGDGTSDPKHYLSASTETYLPPYLADVDPWAGETASDNRYVTVDGVDNLPDMLVGRLPVNSLAEAQTVVDKIVQYETSPPAGYWNLTASFVADDPDGGGDFPALSESLTTYVAPPSMSERIYFTPPENTASQVREAVLQRWNNGAGLIAYTGHSSIHQWAVEQFLYLNDIPTLSNAGRLPVLLELTCFTASFQDPLNPVLDELILRHENGGAVAVWGPTGLSLATGHSALAEGFLQSLYQDGNLGAATLAGKLNLAISAPDSADLLDTFILLGDPATRFDLASGITLYLPLAFR